MALAARQAAKREFGLWLGFVSSPSRMACPEGNHISQGGSAFGLGVGLGFWGGSFWRSPLDRCDLQSTGHTGGRGHEGRGVLR
jgi:hypothetical protein